MKIKQQINIMFYELQLTYQNINSFYNSLKVTKITSH
jgi:hypothetical protein